MAQLTNIIIHCSDSTFGCAREIRKWHLERGWSDIGYHFVILNGWITKSFHIPQVDGSIECGRYLNEDLMITGQEVGAHALGYNDKSIGICLIGNGSPASPFTNKQLSTAYSLVDELMYIFGIKKEAVLGHYETPQSHGKTCPNMDMAIFRSFL